MASAKPASVAPALAPYLAVAAFIETTCSEDAELGDDVTEMLARDACAEDALTTTRTTHHMSGRPEIEQVDIRTDTGRTVGTCRLAVTLLVATAAAAGLALGIVLF